MNHSGFGKTLDRKKEKLDMYQVAQVRSPKRDKNNKFKKGLINLKQRGPIRYHTKKFKTFNLRVKNILEDNLSNLFMETLKDITQNGYIYLNLNQRMNLDWQHKLE